MGPASKTAQANPNMPAFWDARRLETIIPNNKRIIGILDRNSKLLDAEQSLVHAELRVHTLAFEQHVIEPLEDYPTFPTNFDKVFMQ